MIKAIRETICAITTGHDYEHSRNRVYEISFWKRVVYQDIVCKNCGKVISAHDIENRQDGDWSISPINLDHGATP